MFFPFYLFGIYERNAYWRVVTASKMSATTKPSHPIFEDLATNFQMPHLFESPIEEGQVKCRGIVTTPKRKGKRCTRNSRASDEDKHQLCEIWTKFVAVEHSFDQDLLMTQLHDYILFTHCGTHAKITSKKFDKWRLERPSHKPSALQVAENDIKINKDSLAIIVSSDVTDSIDNSNSSDTLSDNETSEKHVEDKIQHQVPVLDFVQECDQTISIIDINDEIIIASDNVNTQKETTDITAPSVEQITQGVAELDIKQHNTADQENEIQRPTALDDEDIDLILNNDTIDQFIDLGITELHRSGSLRDNSPIYRELFKPLSAKSLQEGVVYITKRHQHDDLFKIGWSSVDAKSRHNQHGNCYGIDSTIIYESDKSFLGAYKVETLVHVLLRPKNLLVITCSKCGKGHREWFNAPEDEIRRAVSIMEALVRLPGYTKQGNQWKLSPAAYVLIEGMCKFDPVVLESHLSMNNSKDTVIEITESSTESDEPLEQDRILPSTEGIKPSERPKRTVGTALGSFAKNVKSRVVNFSRGSTPAEGDDENGDTKQAGRRTSAATEIMMQAEAFKQALKMVRRDFKKAYNS